jgi:pimeloyl-ACP methyl ester carboxylesterase
MAGIQATVEASAGDIFAAASYAVTQYNLVYYTIDAQNNLTKASAKLLIPGNSTDLDLVVYLHGTTSLDADAPTNTYADFSAFDGVDPTTIDHNIADMPETAMLMSLVSETNIAVLMPDYLGFGASGGLHPYMHGASLASATIDAIRAALNFDSISSNQFSLTGDFTLTGYSEGGYAVMATHKELLADDGTVESAYVDIMGSDGAHSKAVIPGAPPCNISQRMAAVMLADGYLAPGFAPYVALAYNEIYDIEANISSIFNPTYTFVIDDFDGTKSITDISTNLVLAGYDINIIDDGVANAPIDLFTDTFKTDIMTDYTAIAGNYGATLTDEFYQKFKENDVFDYHVGENVYYEIIYHINDLIVPATNSTDAGAAIEDKSSRPIILHEDLTAYDLGTTHTSGGSYYLLRSFTVSKTLLNAE